MNENLRILEQLEAGELSFDEALGELGRERARAGTSGPRAEAPMWRHWWLIPFYGGMLAVGLGIVLAYQGGFWWLLAGPTLLLGSIVAALSVASIRAPWIHVRIRNRHSRWPHTFGFSLPIPTGFAAWGIGKFGRRLPPLERMAVEDALQALKRKDASDAPLHLQVDEGPAGEKIEIYLG